MTDMNQAEIDALMNDVADRIGVNLTGAVTVEAGGESVTANLN